MTTAVQCAVIKTDDERFLVQVNVPSTANTPPREDTTVADNLEQATTELLRKLKRLL